MQLDPVSTQASPHPQTQGGVHHLLEAISLNCQRMLSYAIRTRGRSLPLSITLITTELLSLWTLSVFDLWGWFFNRKGVGVIAHDFVSMSLAGPAAEPPSFRGVATHVQASLLQNVIVEYQQSARPLAKSYNFQSLANLTRRALHDVAAVEASTQCGYPMHRHLLESIGLAATNAASYNRQTNGETNPICYWFILVQLLSLPGTMLLDRMAHYSHAQNVGILENDVPPIHF